MHAHCQICPDVYPSKLLVAVDDIHIERNVSLNFV